LKRSHLRRRGGVQQKTEEAEAMPDRKIEDVIEEENAFKEEKATGMNCHYCNKYLTSRHSLKHHILVRHEFLNFTDRYFCDVRLKFSVKHFSSLILLIISDVWQGLSAEILSYKTHQGNSLENDC
jgi:hypothetical protein